VSRRGQGLTVDKWGMSKARGPSLNNNNKDVYVSKSVGHLNFSQRKPVCLRLAIAGGYQVEKRGEKDCSLMDCWVWGRKV